MRDMRGRLRVKRRTTRRSRAARCLHGYAVMPHYFDIMMPPTPACHAPRAAGARRAAERHLLIFSPLADVAVQLMSFSPSLSCYAALRHAATPLMPRLPCYELYFALRDILFTRRFSFTRYADAAAATRYDAPQRLRRRVTLPCRHVVVAAPCCRADAACCALLMLPCYASATPRYACCRFSP